MTTIKAKKKKITEAQREAFAAVGRVGGKTTAKRGKKYMADLGRKGAQKRWNKNTPIIH